MRPGAAAQSATEGSSISGMDERSAELLKLPTVRERLAGGTHFAGGRDLALTLAPSPDPAEVAVRVGEVEEAILLADLGVAGPGGALDIREATAEAARGARLEPDVLAGVLATVRVGLELRAAVLEHAGTAPALADRIRFITVPALTRVEGALDRALDPHGGVADTASPELANLRRRLTQARRASSDLLRQLAARLRTHLQEGFTTERGGRPVLAVKAGSRSAVPGIVHDSSGSGATLFIEPLPLIEANNHVRELAAEEAEEVGRILGMLSRLVAEERTHLDVAVEEMAHLDLRLASARLSRAWDGCRVEPSDQVELVGARHPLLDPATAVPVDLPLRGVRALVVSGPNTGGKTVALKTLGLFSMLHQCGLRVPARAAALPVFDRVLADIGDDQSIAESLSTFSAHVRRLMGIMGAVGPRSLVLLDEPAAGTDPDEGARLAQAVIGRLVADGALVLATTHHPEVKEWASAVEGARNAAVAVDLRNLRPLYTLTMGEPGASHALGIAEGLGLDPAVVEAARAAASPARRELEALLADAAAARAAADDDRREARRALARAHEAQADAERRSQELDRRLEALKARAEAERVAARERAEADLAGARRELAELRREISAARREEARRAEGATAAPAPGADRHERERDRRLGAAADRAERARAALERPVPAPEAVEGPPPQVGDHVVDALTGVRGRVVAVRGGRAEVQGGSARMRVPLDRLRVDAAAARAESRRAEREAPPPSMPEGPPVAADVDVRGRRAEETRAEVRTRVDGAAVAGVDRLRVIHGHGTGALRAVVREELARHPLVTRTEPAPPEEGGDGATIAHIAG